MAEKLGRQPPEFFRLFFRPGGVYTGCYGRLGFWPRKGGALANSRPLVAKDLFLFLSSWPKTAVSPPEQNNRNKLLHAIEDGNDEDDM